MTIEYEVARERVKEDEMPVFDKFFAWIITWIRKWPAVRGIWQFATLVVEQETVGQAAGWAYEDAVQKGDLSEMFANVHEAYYTLRSTR